MQKCIAPISVWGQPLLNTNFGTPTPVHCTTQQPTYQVAICWSGVTLPGMRPTYSTGVWGTNHISSWDSCCWGRWLLTKLEHSLSFPVVDQTWHSEAPCMPVISTNLETVCSTSVSAPLKSAALIHHLIWKFARFSIKLVFEVNDRKQGVCGIGESGLEWFIHLATNQLLPIMFQLADAFQAFLIIFMAIRMTLEIIEFCEWQI